MNIVIKRIVKDKTKVQIGILFIEDTPLILTLEPALEGIPHPCIPVGKYKCKRVNNRVTHGGMPIKTTFEVQDVPGRSGILFHVGNSMKDTLGCILPGKGIGKFSIFWSLIAFNEFIDATINIDEFDLEITDVL